MLTLNSPKPVETHKTLTFIGVDGKNKNLKNTSLSIS